MAPVAAGDLRQGQRPNGNDLAAMPACLLSPHVSVPCLTRYLVSQR